MDYQGWLDHFVANAPQGSGMSWTQQVELTGQEKRRIAKSIAAFQLGECSEGNGLLRSAKSFAQSTGNQYITRMTKLFIAEEQFHSMLLRGFMSVHDIPLITSHWADVVFRRLRKSAGFELSIAVLITAEIIALVYYQALRASTDSSQLKRICDRILVDESNHVRYESELINDLRAKRPRLQEAATKLLHEVLFAGTVMVVYSGHRKVLSAGGYSPIEFWRACWAEFSSYFSSSGRVEGSVVIYGEQPQSTKRSSTLD